MVYVPTDKIVNVGSKAILEVLPEWCKKPPAREIVIFLKDVRRIDESRRLLKNLARKADVTWVGSDKYGRLNASFFKGIGVRNSIAPDLVTAGERLFRPGSAWTPVCKAFASNQEALFMILNYLADRCLMQFESPSLMRDAVETVRRLAGSDQFQKQIGPTLQQAVAHYHEAGLPFLAGCTPAINRLKSEVASVASSDLSVMLIGETGTGKEAAAFFLHDFSRRRGKKFVAINCAGLQEQILRSELFGHVQGAFTGAHSTTKGLIGEANGGTLFLDELPDMPPAVQADLLRFLQTRGYRQVGGTDEKQADVRIIAAGQPRMQNMLHDGTLRRDLYFRIADVVIRTPALRDVPDDIIRVIRHVVFRKYIREGQRHITVDEALSFFTRNLDVLKGYSWPGNFRELVSVVKVHLQLGKSRDVIDELRERMQDAKRTSCGTDPSRQGASGRSEPRAGTALATNCPSGTVDEAINQLVATLPEPATCDAVMRKYVGAVRKRWSHVPIKTLAKTLDVAENTLRKRLANE